MVALIAAMAAFAVRPAPRQRVIGVLSHASLTLPALDGLKEGLSALGRREGDRDGVVYKFSGPLPLPEAMASETRRLLAEKVDLVVALSTPAALAAAPITEAAGVPLLFAPSSDPVAAGLVKSIPRPGRPITGVTFGPQEPRRLEWLVRLAPKVHTVWFPYAPDDPSPRATLARLQPVADRLGVTLMAVPLRDPAELAEALEHLPPEVDALFVPPDAMIADQIAMLAAAAAARRLPLTVPHRGGVARGALFSWGFDLHALGRQAARLADQILAGTAAADLPVETAEAKLSINLATAELIGIDIPDDVLGQSVVFGRQERR
jgi:putative tryptophan/tyrosine transport system substrate-binding protein